tara:strand:- start:777 stop:1031 length:255 start_codon:yes stop_codon:yes gene_type:complete
MEETRFKTTTTQYLYVVHAAFWDGGSYSHHFPAVIGVFDNWEDAEKAQQKAWSEWNGITSYSSQCPKITQIPMGRYNDEWTEDY